MTSVLVLGGARSGKSAYAERLLAAQPRVRYLAPGPVPDGSDTAWAARVAGHRARRPPAWETVETGDAAAALTASPAGTAVLLDCLGTWLTRVLDDAGAWADPGAVDAAAGAAADRLVEALDRARDRCDVVIVSPEVGLGVVPATAGGRTFRDALGGVNEIVGRACDRVALVVAGRVLDLTHAPLAAGAPPLAPRQTQA